MRHQPFVQALTDCGGEHHPEWAALCSGLLVLRHFDDWLAVGPAHTGEDRDAAERVRQQISTIPDSASEVRALLETVLDILGKANPTDVVGAVGPLLAYGMYLEYTDQQRLGQHVLSIVTGVLDSPAGATDLQSVASAYLQHGRVAYRVGDLDDAEARFTRGLVLAEQAGDYPLTLYAELYLGRLWTIRGDFASAESLLNTVVAAAREHQLLVVEACALRVRGSMLQVSGRHGDAIRDLSAAYSLTQDRSIRELLLSDLAACACELGLWQAASAIQEKLVRTAHSVTVRGVALINLLETALMQGDQDKYHTIWMELHTHYLESMPFGFSLYAQFYAAQGVGRFRNASDAIVAYRAVATRAQELGTSRVEGMARERLDVLLAGEGMRPRDTDLLPASSSPSPPAAEARPSL